MSLMLRTAGIGLAAALAAAGVAGMLLPRSETTSPAVATRGPVATSPLPAAKPSSGHLLIERSPFAPNRAAFVRNAGPPAPEIEVKLAGIFKVGQEMRASLVIGGQSVVVRKGDQTPAGVVKDVEASAVVLEGTSPRRIDMFKQ